MSGPAAAASSGSSNRPAAGAPASTSSIRNVYFETMVAGGAASVAGGGMKEKLIRDVMFDEQDEDIDMEAFKKKEKNAKEVKVKEKSKEKEKLTLLDVGTAKKKKKLKEAAKTKADRAGLLFPVGRIHSLLKAKIPASCRVGGIKRCCWQLLELSGNHAKQSRKKEHARITPQFLNFAIKQDPEFNELLSRVMVSGAGVVPKSTKDLEGMYGKGGKKTGKEGVDGGLLAGGGGENEEEPLLI
eukprot:g19080.t1